MGYLWDNYSPDVKIQARDSGPWGTVQRPSNSVNTPIYLCFLHEWFSVFCIKIFISLIKSISILFWCNQKWYWFFNFFIHYFDGCVWECNWFLQVDFFLRVRLLQGFFRSTDERTKGNQFSVLARAVLGKVQSQAGIGALRELRFWFLGTGKRMTSLVPYCCVLGLWQSGSLCYLGATLLS